MTASAAVTAGYTLAAGPVRADVIKTDTDGLTAGDAKIKVADGEMPAPHGFHADYRASYRKEAADDAWRQMQAGFRKYHVLG